ncbi:MAG TPA: Hsp70 family protein, partial [Kofleriaceae bacterium]|nr:Hsp70 family protein [Kofleriaceae bacterium]
TDTETFANEAPTANRDERPVTQQADELIELLQQDTPASRGQSRQTAGYRQVEPPPPARGERAATRGEHHDVFEERTPTPTPPAGPVIGRLTRPVTAPGAKSSVRTTQAIGTVRPPAPPRSTTITIPPKPPPGPASTLRGIAPVHEEDAFSNLETEQSPDLEPPERGSRTMIVEEPVVPPTTAKGFSAPTMTQPLPTTGRAPGALPLAPPAPPRGASPPPVPSAPPSAPTMIAQPPSAPTIVADPPSLPQTFPVMPSPVVMDVTPRGLGIATVAGYCEELIRRNSRVPTETRKLFTTSRDSQDSVRIVVCQGESRRLDNNVVLGDLRLEGLPKRPRGETSIEVTFALDANGILQVRARDPQTGREQRASLDIVGTMQKQDVEAAREKLQALRR